MSVRGNVGGRRKRDERDAVLPARARSSLAGGGAMERPSISLSVFCFTIARCAAACVCL